MPLNRKFRRARRNGGRSESQRTLVRIGAQLLDLMSIATVGGHTDRLLLGFNRPVRAGTPSSVGSTDINATATSGTTRHGIGASNVSPNFVTVTFSGALSSGKTYTVQCLEKQGLIVPVDSRWQTQQKTVAT